MSFLYRPINWTEWASVALPNRLGETGLWANFIGLGFILPADTVSQARVEAVLARSQNEATSPTDILGFLAQEAGLDVYPGESFDALRSRIKNKWDTWSKCALAATIITELKYFITTQGSTADVNIVYNPVIGSGGHPEWNIPMWPADVNWWSQMIVTIDLTLAIGSLAESRSVLLSNTQLNIIQSIIKKFQPADFAVREIIIRQGLALPTGCWDDPTMTWDSGTWDPSSGAVIVELYHA